MHVQLTQSESETQTLATAGAARRWCIAVSSVALWIGVVVGCKSEAPPPPPPPLPPVPTSGFDTCSVDADCGLGEIDHEIQGSEDCPCLYGCPFTPLNTSTIERRQSQYDRACDPSENGNGDSCGIDDCALPPAPACIAGRCSAAR